MRGTYSRWTKERDDSASLTADILGDDTYVMAHPDSGEVEVGTPARPLSPDEARMIGVRLIEAAALADGERAIRT
jgi:hypothetical protein